MTTYSVPAASVRGRRRDEPEWIVWLTVLLGLLVGAFFIRNALTQSATATVGDVSFQYPARWAQVDEPGTAFAAEDLGSAPFGPRLSLRQLPPRPMLSTEPNLVDAATGWSIERGSDLVGYRVVGLNPTTVGSREAVEVEFAYLADPSQGSASGAMPALMHGIDTVVASGDGAHVLSFVGEQTQWEALQGLRQRIIESWKLP